MWCRDVAGSVWTCARRSMHSATRWRGTCSRNWSGLPPGAGCATSWQKRCASPPPPVRPPGSAVGNAPWPGSACRYGACPVAPAMTRCNCTPSCRRRCCSCAAKTPASATTRSNRPPATTCNWPQRRSPNCCTNWPKSRPKNQPEKPYDARLPLHRARCLDRAAFRRTSALLASAGARAHRHPPRRQRAPCRAHGRTIAGLWLRRRKACRARRPGARLRHGIDHQPDRAPPLRPRRLGAPHRAEPPRRCGSAPPKLDPSPPYAAAIGQGRMYGRATAVSKSDFASFTFAVRALEAVARPRRGAVELHFTYDEEFGGELGPGWLLDNGLTRPDLVIAAGFSYELITAHNGCLQLEVTVHGKMAHAAVAHTGVDALQGAVQILNALYAQNRQYQQICSRVPGITHPYLNVGRIEGGINTNVVPGKISFKLDRRMIPEENPVEVEAQLRSVIEQAASAQAGISVDIQRLLLARAMMPLAGNQPLVEAIQKHGQAVLGVPIATRGTPLYTDARLYAERGIPGVIYGAGPRTVLESHAKRADERLELQDLRRPTQVIARSLHELLMRHAGLG